MQLLLSERKPVKNHAAPTAVSVFAPTGWTKEVVGNDQGLASFIPEWPGTYMIEISRTDDEKGDHHGKPYERVWRCATYLLEVRQ